MQAIFQVECGQVLALQLDVPYAVQHLSLVPDLLVGIIPFECHGGVELQQLLVIRLGLPGWGVGALASH